MSLRVYASVYVFRLCSFAATLALNHYGIVTQTGHHQYISVSKYQLPCPSVARVDELYVIYATIYSSYNYSCKSRAVIGFSFKSLPAAARGAIS